MLTRFTLIALIFTAGIMGQEPVTPASAIAQELSQPAAVGKPSQENKQPGQASPHQLRQGYKSGEAPAVPEVGTGDQENFTKGLSTLHLIVGRSLFVDTKERLRRVYVSNPAVLDSMVAAPSQLVITAKAAGTSSLVLWSETGESTMYTVLADVDVAGLRDSLAQALPGDRIEVKAEQGKIYLSGVVGSEGAADQAGQIAGVYSKEIVNSLVVDPRHLPQVRLQVRFAELDRSKLDQTGINFLSGGKNLATTTTGMFTPATASGSSGTGALQLGLSDLLNLFYFNRDLDLGVTIKLLQGKGILEMLAEPTLATISGKPAKFLAGGEFPYPVIQGSNGGFTSVTIQFRPYGVRLEFTPFVNPDGSIRMRVNPEVSALDYTNAVTISGYTIPAISTRRADTEVGLQSGQSFGISGLLDHRVTDNLSKIPGIGDIPILGQLFRSKNLNHTTSELIVIVTPTIVDPLTNRPRQSEPTPAWPVPFLDPGKFDQGLPSETTATPTKLPDGHEN